MIKKLTLFTALMFLASSVAFSAVKEDNAFVKGIRPMSMGGAFVAVADDENAFFYNPAGIAQRSGKLIQFLSLDMSVNTETTDFMKFFSDNKDDLEDFDKLSSEEKADLLNKINKEILDTKPHLMFSMPNFAFISGPINLPSNHLTIGAGLFSYADAYFSFNKSLFVPSLTYKGQVTAIAAIPVAYQIESLSALRLPGKLSIGANFKYLYRGVSEVDDLSVDEFEDFDVPYQYGGGFGMDFGLIYHLNSRWNIGMQLTDAFTTKIDYSEHDDDNPLRSKDSYTAEIDPEFNIGAAYFPEKIYYWPGKYIETGNNITIAADLTDIANDDETLSDSFWKKVHFGAEVKFLKFFVARAGVNSGYPTFGAGIETGVVQLQYAFYGEEEGRYASQDPVWFHRVLFSIKTGKSGGRHYDKPKEKDKDKTDIKDDSGAFEDVPGSEKENEDADDVKPASIPKDAKETISKSAEITEVK